MPGGVRAEAIPSPDAQYSRALADVAEPLDQEFAKILGRSRIDRYMQSEDKAKLEILRERITNITSVNRFASVSVLASEGVRVQQQVLRHLLFNVFFSSHIPADGQKQQTRNQDRDRHHQLRRRGGLNYSRRRSARHLSTWDGQWLN